MRGPSAKERSLVPSLPAQVKASEKTDPQVPKLYTHHLPHATSGDKSHRTPFLSREGHMCTVCVPHPALGVCGARKLGPQSAVASPLGPLQHHPRRSSHSRTPHVPHGALHGAWHLPAMPAETQRVPQPFLPFPGAQPPVWLLSGGCCAVFPPLLLLSSSLFRSVKRDTLGVLGLSVATLGCSGP